MMMTNISVSPEVKAALPDVLIDWLCTLVTSGKDRKNPGQTIALTLEKLGNDSIQNIRYAGKLRRVFGFPPVICNLQVRYCDNQYQMAMAN